MSVHTSEVRYRIYCEGAEESVTEFQAVLSEVNQGIGLISRLDYVTLSWQRGMQKLDMRSFLSVTLSTISALQSVISFVRTAELATIAYNAQLVIRRLLEGPTGWAILAVAGIGVGVGAYSAYSASRSAGTTYVASESYRRRAEELGIAIPYGATGPEIAQLIREREETQREEYRTVVPG